MDPMESRCKQASIRARFSDHFLTKRITIDLAINDNYILRDDYYHLMSKDWPKS